MNLDNWQEEVLATSGNICLRSGRQVGKSTIIGLKAAKYALENQNKLVMVISRTERQAGLLFTKILFNILQINKLAIKKGKDRPTKHIINLKNGSVIHCLPCGDTGYGIMGFTIDLLIADEAAFIPEEVWNSIIPSLAITRGCIWLLSTPYVKEGYYYECFDDPTFTAFHTSSEDCPRRDDVFLAHKKKLLSKARYAQMYLGEFRDEIRQWYSDDLIRNTCILPGSKSSGPALTSLSPSFHKEYFLGVDIARLGEDDSTFEIIDGTNKKNLIHVENIVTSKTLTTQTTQKILELEDKYHFKQIFIDAYGLGVGVFDQLLTDPRTRRKVIAIGHWHRPLDKEEKKKTKLTKEDLHDNLRSLMQRKEIKLINDDEIKASLKSIHAEYSKETGKLKVEGEDAHIADGLIRAAWCSKDKTLNIQIHWM